EQIGPWQDLELAAEELLSEVPEAERQRYLVQGGHLFVGAHQPKPDSPAIGDLRIGFRAVDPAKVSLLGQLQVDHLVAYRTSNGEEIASVEDGEKSAAQMFDSLRMQNSTLAWLLRGAGWVLACVGFGLIAGPISTLASVIPFLGRITGAATFFVAVILGSVVALTAIGVAWVAVRPLWAIGLFAIAGGGLYLLMRRPKPQSPPMATLVE
ncbi:MAG: TMEM43 family protein, partial [Pirellulaceae bacterium]|nr:TMEM43 family protein [Pirellulaceae bacterium]